MDTKKYEVLEKTVELSSLTKAAQELGLTQSGVSHMLAAIEAELMRLLSEAGAAAFRQQATLAHEDMLRRLAEAEARLQKTLQDIDKN